MEVEPAVEMEHEGREHDGENEAEALQPEHHEGRRRERHVHQRRAGRTAEIGGKKYECGKLGKGDQKAAGDIVDAMRQRHQKGDDARAMFM